MKGYCNILGISAFFHDSAAALVDGMEIRAAAQEERFTRVKHDAGFPHQAVEFCLSKLRSSTELDAVAFYEKPLAKLDRIYRNAIRNAPRGAPIWRQTLETTNTLSHSLQLLLDILDDPSRIHFVGHHRSHAASAFYPSGFEQAAVLVVDGVGEWSTTSIWSGAGNRLDPLRELRFPHSLGLFYSAFTQYCGFKVNSGEYKLMGLAPYGEPVFKQKLLDEFIDVKPDGSFALNLKYFKFQTEPTTISPLIGHFFQRHARNPGEDITQHYCNIAASVQAATNEVITRLARTALALVGTSRLCMAGGVALNCVANSAMLRRLPELKSVWTQPASSDAGGALGAALEVAMQSQVARPTGANSAAQEHPVMKGAYLGCAFEQQDIKDCLQEHGLTFETPSSEEALTHFVAEALADQQIIGHFNGAMEFGPRALGNRSILADPRSGDMLEAVNRRIKFREAWRPFAPVVLRDHAAEFFEGPGESPYMLLISDLKRQHRKGVTVADLRARGICRLDALQRLSASAFHAVTHVDYSARLQVLDDASNPRLSAILRHFLSMTGCPMLLNTSFNVRGEPIVCTPLDAVKCFLNSRLDILVIGPFIVRRNVLPEALKSGKVGAMRFNAD